MMLRIIFLVLASALLAACAPNISPNTYTQGDIGVANHVVQGIIVDKRPVVIDNNSGAGGVAGTAAGAAAGSTIGGGAAANIVGAIGVAVVGGLVGNAIDRSIHTHPGYDYIIRLRHGGLTSITQLATVNLPIGTHVYIEFGALTRIVPDPSWDSGSA